MAQQPNNGRDTLVGFLEHLRQVHFVLVAASATILVACFGNDRSKGAIADLASVFTIVEHWKAEALELYIKHLEETEAPVAPLDAVIQQTDPRTFRVQILKLRPPTAASQQLSEITAKWRVPRIGASVTEDSFSLRKPRTLNEFRDMWDALCVRVAYVYPIGYHSNISIVPLEYEERRAQLPTPEGAGVLESVFTLDEIRRSASQDSIRFESTYGTLKEVRPRGNEGQGMSPAQMMIALARESPLDRQYVLEFDISGDGDVSELGYFVRDPSTSSWRTISHTPRRGSSSRELGLRRRVSLQCNVATNDFFAVLALTRGQNGLVGFSFAEQFPNLAEYVSRYGSMDLAALVSELNLQGKEGKGGDLSVLGVSLPRAYAGLIGPLVLVLAQMYFLMHLSATVSSAKDPVLFPCVLIYERLPSRIFAYVTGCFLCPVVAVVAATKFLPLGWIVVTLASIAALALAVWTAVVLHGLRSRLSGGGAN